MRFGRITRITTQSYYLAHRDMLANLYPKRIWLKVADHRILIGGVFDDNAVAKGIIRIHSPRFVFRYTIHYNYNGSVNG